jgi:hypothetical protein
MRARILPVLPALLIASCAAEAQQSTVLLAGRETPIDTAARQRQATQVRRVTTRSLTALVGMAAGMYAGYRIGDTYTPVTEKRDGFGDRAMGGMALGLFAGTALGAALPSYDSPCPFSARFWRGLGGSVVGLVPAVLLGPIGPAVGAAAFQGRC